MGSVAKVHRLNVAQAATTPALPRAVPPLEQIRQTYRERLSHRNHLEDLGKKAMEEVNKLDTELSSWDNLTKAYYGVDLRSESNKLGRVGVNGKAVQKALRAPTPASSTPATKPGKFDPMQMSAEELVIAYLKRFPKKDNGLFTPEEVRKGIERQFKRELGKSTVYRVSKESKLIERLHEEHGLFRLRSGKVATKRSRRN